AFPADHPRIRIEEVRWSDLNAIRQRAIALHQETRFDGIATLEEMMIDFAAELRAELGVAGMHPEESRRFRDKTEMKRRLAGSGVRTPSFCPCSDREGVRRLLFEHEKLILKPIDGQGARQVSFVES